MISCIEKSRVFVESYFNEVNFKDIAIDNAWGISPDLTP